jgi:hypothetical protein
MVRNRTQLYQHYPNILGMLYPPATTNCPAEGFLQGLAQGP